MSDTTLDQSTTPNGNPQRNGGVVSRFMDGFRAIPRVMLWFIVAVWATPTIGLFISGWRTRDDQRSIAWCTGLNPFNWTFVNYDTVFGASAASDVSKRHVTECYPRTRFDN